MLFIYSCKIRGEATEHVRSALSYLRMWSVRVTGGVQSEKVQEEHSLVSVQLRL